MKKSICERVKLAKEVDISFEETSKEMNKEIIEDIVGTKKASNTMEDIGFSERLKNLSKKNNLAYERKEGIDFQFVVAQNVQVNIKEYFKFDDCDKCENLRNDYTPLDVLVEDSVNLEEKDESDIFENPEELEMCRESEFLVSLECEVENLIKKNFELVSRLWTLKNRESRKLRKTMYRYMKFKGTLKLRNQELELLCEKYSAVLNQQEVVLKEIIRILEDKFKVKNEELVQLVQKLADIKYELKERVEEGTSFLLENEELGSMCKEYLLRLDQLKAEVELHRELSGIDRESSKRSSSVLGKKRKTSGKTKSKQNVWSRNENSSMVLCLRNRAMRMKDCTYDLILMNENLELLVYNEEIVRQEIAEVRLHECNFNRKLDMVQREKKDLIELLTWLKSSNDYVSRVEELVTQRTHRQRYFGQNYRAPLVQRTSNTARVSGSKITVRRV